jgi:hypothetical protein
MSVTRLYRLGAVAGFLSGVCMILGRVLASLPNTQPGEIVDWFSPTFALFFAIFLYLGQRRESGVFGGIAFIVLFAGLLVVVCLDFYGAFMRIYLPADMIAMIEEGASAPVFVMGLLTFLIGEIIFGISVIRAGVYSKIAAVLFMAGLIPTALHPTGIFPEGMVDIGAAAAGVGLIWWSVELYRLAETKLELA